MKPESFKKWRKARKMTQTQAANALGIDQATVSRYENGATNLTELDLTLRLAMAAVAKGIKPWKG